MPVVSARGIKTYGSDAIAIPSQGESSATEGFVYEAINGASLESLPVIFVFQNNRYGISVPREEQTANRRSSDNFKGLRNLHIIHCDGKDIFDSMNAMDEAKKHIHDHGEPVIVHASVVRMGSHSNSDRHELYRDERELEESRRLAPLLRFRAQLIRSNKFTEKQLDEIDKQVKDIVSKAHKKAIKEPDPKPESIYNYATPEPFKPQKYVAGTHE